MALVAGDREVRAGERVGGLRVLLGPETGGPEAVHVVAASQRPPSARFASWPAWASAWQSVQRSCFTRIGRPGTWHFSQLTPACRPVSG